MALFAYALSKGAEPRTADSPLGKAFLSLMKFIILGLVIHVFVLPFNSMAAIEQEGIVSGVFDIKFATAIAIIVICSIILPMCTMGCTKAKVRVVFLLPHAKYAPLNIIAFERCCLRTGHPVEQGDLLGARVFARWAFVRELHCFDCRRYARAGRVYRRDIQ